MAVQHNIMKGLCCGYTYQQLATNSFHRVIHITTFATLEAFVPDLMDWFVMAHLVMIGPADHMQHGKCQSCPASILQRLGAPVVEWKVYQQVRKSLLANINKKQNLLSHNDDCPEPFGYSMHPSSCHLQFHRSLHGSCRDLLTI